MLTNKWVMLILGGLGAVVGFLITQDWKTIDPADAGYIVLALGVIHTVLAGLMPPNNQQVITKTSGTFFTHT